MRFTGKLRSIAETLLLGTLTHACGDAALDGIACGGVGCDSSFVLAAPLALPLDIVQRAEIEVCRNAECHTGSFGVSNGLGKDGRSLPKRTTARIVLSTSPLQLISAEVAQAGHPETLALFVSWTWDWSAAPGSNGDEFTVSIRADGGTLYSTHRVVDKYNIFQPNGADPPCGGLTCGQAESVDEQLLEDARRQRDQDMLECRDRDGDAGSDALACG